jgi:hypothetical protein
MVLSKRRRNNLDCKALVPCRIHVKSNVELKCGQAVDTDVASVKLGRRAIVLAVARGLVVHDPWDDCWSGRAAF